MPPTLKKTLKEQIRSEASATKLPAPPANPTIDDARAVLKRHWGYDDFRPAQVPCIEAGLSRKDGLFVLPTGGGKSAIFQVLSLLYDGCCLVISPLIALMKDQVDDCARRGIPATCVNSHVDDDEIEDRFLGLVKGKYKVFYCAPERMNSVAFRDAIQNAKINFIAVDEAHCASRWGHDFRPEYMRIHAIVEMLTTIRGRPPLLALTATATRDIEEDLCKSLGMSADYIRVIGDPVRPNLNYRIANGNPWKNFEYIVQDMDVEKGRFIVYAGTRKGCERLANIMVEQKPSLAGKIGFYHAGMAKPEREAVQDGFKSGKLRVVVATNAFGMGIDVPDIRAVIHFGIPGSVEDYCQEAGRGGRDGLPADATLIHDDYSVGLRQMFVDMNNPPFACYQIVWDYLRECYEPGAVVALTCEEMADEIQKKLRKGITDQQVCGTLSVMRSYGLVLRLPADSGVVVNVDIAALEALAQEGFSSQVATHLAQHILTKAVEKAEFEKLPGCDRPSVVEMVLDKEAVADQLECSETAIAHQLRNLAPSVNVEKVFRGKTTQVVREKWDCNLAVEIKREDIEKKRRREQGRLDAMVAYTRAPSRTDFIRKYFMGEGA